MSVESVGGRMHTVQVSVHLLYFPGPLFLCTLLRIVHTYARHHFLYFIFLVIHNIRYFMGHESRCRDEGLTGTEVRGNVRIWISKGVRFRLQRHANRVKVRCVRCLSTSVHCNYIAGLWLKLWIMEEFIQYYYYLLLFLILFLLVYSCYLGLKLNLDLVC